MKSIYPGLVIILVFLPQMSFGANPPTIVTNPVTIVNPLQATCNQQIGVESTTFWRQAAADRAAFGKANPQSMANHDKHFMAQHAIDMATRQGKSTSGLSTPSDDDPAFLAFEQKQQSDQTAFLAKMNQDMQNCLAGTSPSTTSN